jgi:phage I-like protein
VTAVLRGNLQKRLEDVRTEILRAREAARILDEQVAYQQGVADEAETAAVVAETPLAHREQREADGDLRRLRTQRDELRERIAALTAEQDDLLDRLLEQGNG